ncbi:hypothetical protein [Bacillus cereus]|uniref:hypothetical protein n=1 Tax=Bacillus cereus TaxID=1396 RepID=UPI000BFC5442|nr:hypothetical protein [Bacillus cereus]PGU51825.1 hypothetical protein COD72_23040 [Bacillus cereus]
MASINGIEIKTYTTFKGHDGQPLRQATVYMDGKKIGSISEDAWGGPMNINLKNYVEVEKRLFEYASHEKFAMHALKDIELLFDLLLGLIFIEKQAKKAWKQNDKAIIISAGLRDYYLQEFEQIRHIPMLTVYTINSKLTENQLMERMEKVANENKAEALVFKTLQDFSLKAS